MENKYRKDTDLELLHYADNEMLAVLVEYLTVDQDGEPRISEELTANEVFKRAGKNYQKVWQLIAAELQHYGGNTFINLVRRKGVSYQEILIDVCKKAGLKTDFDAETVDIEQALLAFMFDKTWGEMTEEQRADIRKQLKIDPSLTGAAAISALLAGVRLGGSSSYQVAMIIANSVAKALTGHGFKLVANAGVSRGLGLAAGPFGVALSGVLALQAVSGPAFRVTMPCVIQIAAIRQQILNQSAEKPFF